MEVSGGTNVSPAVSESIFIDFGRAVTVKAGEPVTFTAEVEVPAHGGSVTRVAWDYECTNDWSEETAFDRKENGGASAVSTHVFTKPGVYYPVVKVQSSRTGNTEDIFVQCRNLDRVKVEVEQTK